VYFLHKNKLTG